MQLAAPVFGLVNPGLHSVQLCVVALVLYVPASQGLQLTWPFAE
jgi:hypothetical protein